MICDEKKIIADKAVSLYNFLQRLKVMENEVQDAGNLALLRTLINGSQAAVTAFETERGKPIVVPR